ncbi:MAG: hypothetical protein ACJ73S_33135, partial [Mycobacteriales bacterium]
GHLALVALRARDSRILANAALRPTARGWRIVELQARFNHDPGEELRRRVRAWVAGLPGPDAPDTAAPPARRSRSGRHRPAHPSPAARLARDLGGRVADLVAAAAAEPASAHATTVIAALAAREGTAGDPYGALTALRRATGDRPLAAACRRALADPAGLVALWQATGDRPLARVLAGLPDADADRLGPLLLDAPLPRTLRALARLPGIAPVRTGHLVALRVRAALGTLLREDASELARAVDADPYAPLVRAAALAVTSWGGLNAGAVTAVLPARHVEIPDFPRSALNDQRWEASWPDATELGAVADGFWDHIADHGLLLPVSWLSGGGWPALWSRAARHRPPGTLSG